MTINCKISAYFLFLLLASSFTGRCQDINVLLKEAEELEDSHKENEAFKKYKEAIKVQPQNLIALCKASELSGSIGDHQTGKSSRLEYFTVGRRYAESALQINPNYADANFVMSLAMGRLALVLSGGEKIQAVKDIRKYAENAVRNDPKNFKALHVLGKWHYEVSSLNGFEKTAVKVFFGGLRPSSFDESISYYEKSRSLRPDFALNYLEMAKAYHKNRQDNKAIEILQKLQTVQTKNADDPRIKKEGNEFLKELKGS